MTYPKVFSKIFTIFYIILINSSHEIESFNVDTENPVIITNSCDGVRSYFGTTVSLAKGKFGPTPSTGSWVIIGTPNANSTQYKNINEPGVVWRCSLGKGNSDSCDILEMDNHGNEMQRHHAPGEDVYNRKDGGLLGGSASIGSDRYVTCASRWSNQRANNISFTSHYLMNGLCYWRPVDQILQDFVPNLLTNHTLIPLRNKDRQGFKGRKGFDWTFGQAGFSVHISDQLETIFGAPGVHDWKGTVIRLRDSGESRLRRNGLPEDNGKFYQGVQLVMKPELEISWKQNNTYFGYAVASGKFLEAEDGGLQYVASAPRGGFQNNLVGHVIIFKFPKTDQLPLEILSKLDGPLESGTYFGSVLCSVDLNNDGWSDLIVGAPLYSTGRSARLTDSTGSLPPTTRHQSPTTFMGHGDEGGAFVYLSDRNKMVYMDTLVGMSESWSHFGSAIASIGDINRDGFNDVAIGAPYEDSKRGAVYIYHGSSIGLSEKFAQVIHAKDLDTRLMGFGFSLSPGVDMDENGYTDFAVGAYSSAQVVILRTKPIVQITGNVTSDITKIPINTKDVVFTVASCVGYNSKDSIPQIALRVKLYSDVDSKISRIYIKDGSFKPTTFISYEVKVKFGKSACRKFTGVVKQGLKLSGHPVVIRQEVLLLVDKATPKGTSDYRILPPELGERVPRTEQIGTAFNSFCKYCPVTETNVTIATLTLQPIVPCGEDDKCTADLSIRAEFRNYTQEEYFVIGSTNRLNLTIELFNSGEPAIHPKLKISWLRRSLVNIPPECAQIIESTHVLICALGQTLGKNQGKKLELEFDMSDMVAGEQNGLNQFAVDIDATTISELVTPVVFLQLILPITAQAKLTIFAPVKSMNFTTVNPYNVFTHSYLIKLDGPSTVKKVELQFDIPDTLLKSSSDKFIFNITQIEAKYDGNLIMCDGPSSLSSLFSTRDPDFDGLPDDARSNQPVFKRDLKKRSAEYKGLEELIYKHSMILDCKLLKIKCIQIFCVVNNFRSTGRTTVDITFRMPTNEILSMMYENNIQNIEFRSKGKAIMIDVDNIIQEKSNTNECITRLILPLGSNNSLVWIGSSIAAGLLILLCIGLLLYCLGVFDRKKPVEDEVDEPLPESVPLQNFEPEIVDGNLPKLDED